LDVLDIAYLNRLVADKHAETFELEYKSSASLHSEREQRARGVSTTKDNAIELSKDVSAMANANSGRIIYGINERNSLAHSLDSGSPIQNKKSEWIDQVCSTHIHPRIEGLKIASIPATVAGYEYLIVDVPKAVTQAPHQAGDYRYYQRQNTTTVVLEDYQIRDLRRRSESPDLVMLVRGRVISADAVNNMQTVKLTLTVRIKNGSETPSLYNALDFWLDERLRILSGFWRSEELWLNLTHPDGTLSSRCKRYTSNHMVPACMPIFSGTEFHLFDAQVEFTHTLEDYSDATFAYAWSVVAPGFPRRARAGSFSIESPSNTIHFHEENEINIP
jgi:hypothetical protein